MQESEFRDWARRAQGDFNERLKALETRVGALSAGPVRFRMPEHYRAFDGLLLRMKEAIAAGGVTGLGFALVRDEGVVEAGWIGEDFDQYALAGAVSQLHVSILDRAIRAASEGLAEGATDEGNPPGGEARGPDGPAPANARIVEGVSGGKA